VEQQRSEFRIVYPLPARPVAQVGDREFRVLDASEHALRFDLRRHAIPVMAGERIAGRVRLAQGADHAFEGSVLRIDERSAVILLDEVSRIDLSVIFREQRYLRSKFPNWR
jgi:PilZ domain